VLSSASPKLQKIHLIVSFLKLGTGEFSGQPLEDKVQTQNEERLVGPLAIVLALLGAGHLIADSHRNPDLSCESDCFDAIPNYELLTPK